MGVIIPCIMYTKRWVCIIHGKIRNKGYVCSAQSSLWFFRLIPRSSGDPWARCLVLHY